MPEVVKSVIIVMELEDDQEWFQEPEEPEEMLLFDDIDLQPEDLLSGLEDILLGQDMEDEEAPESEEPHMEADLQDLQEPSQDQPADEENEHPETNGAS